MNILVVEDDKLQREGLVAIIEKNFLDIRVYKAASIKQAVEKIENVDIDLFFIDINLSGESGLALAEAIRGYDEHKLTGIVFITGEVIHIVEAFKKIHCYDFIVKPYIEEEIKKIITIFFNGISVQAKNKEKYTFLELDTNLSVKLLHKDIIYIEFLNKTNRIHTTNGMYIIKRMPLSRLIESINDEQIVQTHRAFAVNMACIKTIKKEYEKIWSISLHNSTETILLSNTYRADVLRRLE